MAPKPQFTAVERAVIAFGKAMVALVCVFGVWALLVSNFVVCCAVNTIAFTDPRVSPMGPIITVSLVWPAIGFLCMMAQGIGGGVNEIFRSATARARAWLRPR